MKRMMIRWLLSIVLMLAAGTRSQAVVLDGRTTIVYEATAYPFLPGDSALGFVRLNGGFVLPAGTVHLDIVTTVSGTIVLGPGATVSLGNSLHLSSQVTLIVITMGLISGHGNTIFLDGDLTIPLTETLNFVTDTIIDGGGHTLLFDGFAKMTVDSNVTLTLKNLVLKSTNNTIGGPVFTMADNTSFLALENVTWCMADDFRFQNGRLFIHDDVVMTGSTRFIYNSDQQSYIAPCSNWYFDKGTTLVYDSPTTSTDLIQMQHKTSTLIFDNATLAVTGTGMRLSKGRLCLDNKVTISATEHTLTPTGLVLRNTIATGFGSSMMVWRPDTQYAAVSNLATTATDIYQFNRSTYAFTLVTSVGVGGEIDWSPDGQYLAISDGATLFVYKFDGTSLTLVASILMVADGTRVRWHPSGQFIGVSYIGGFGIRAYKFNGTSLTLIATTPNSYTDLSWRHDGNFVAGANSGTALEIYSFNGSTLTFITTTAASSSAVDWSSRDPYIVTGGMSSISIYSFNGVTLTLVATTALPPTETVFSLSWNPDGGGFVAGNFDGTFSIGLLRLYSFNGASVRNQQNFVYAAAVAPFVDWSLDGKFVGVGEDGNLHVYEVFYDFSRALQFGDSAKGPTFDLDVSVLAAARVGIFGLLHYDNFS